MNLLPIAGLPSGASNSKPDQGSTAPKSNTDQTSTSNSGQTSQSSGTSQTSAAPPPTTSETADAGQQTGNNGSSTQAEKPASRSDLTVARTSQDLPTRAAPQSVVEAQVQAPSDADAELANARAAAEAYQAEYARTSMIAAISQPVDAPSVEVAVQESAETAKPEAAPSRTPQDA